MKAADFNFLKGMEFNFETGTTYFKGMQSVVFATISSGEWGNEIKLCINAPKEFSKEL